MPKVFVVKVTTPWPDDFIKRAEDTELFRTTESKAVHGNGSEVYLFLDVKSANEAWFFAKNLRYDKEFPTHPNYL